MRLAAAIHEKDAKRLFELSEIVAEERSVADLIETIVTTVQNVFATRGVALLLPVDDQLEVVAAVGDPFNDEELAAAGLVFGLAGRSRYQRRRARRVTCSLVVHS